MRKDMKKVIIERPRVGGSYHKEPHPYIDPKKVDDGFDSGPNRESLTKKMGWEMKRQTDVLGPLTKFLQSNLGRPWDDVWSEICENNKDWMGAHLKRHVKYEVETNVHEEDGRLVDDRGFRVDGFYVDPATGKLAKTKDEARWRYKPRPQCIFHMDGTDYYKHNGIWYRAVFEEWKCPRPGGYGFASANDVFGNGGHDYTRGGGSHLERKLYNAYGKSVYAKSKQQANSKECKLLNDMAEKSAKGKRAA
jgi:hypothetical protein